MASYAALHSQHKDVWRHMMLQDAPVGLPNPAPPVVRTTPFGALPAGVYQFSAVFEAEDGEESGASAPTPVTVTYGQGVSVELAPCSDPRAVRTRLYATPPNGEAFYAVSQRPKDVVTQWTLCDPLAYGAPLQTRYLLPMPSTALSLVWRERCFRVAGARLLFSEPMRFGLYRPDTGYFRFPEAIQAVTVSVDGLRVTAGADYILTLHEPLQGPFVIHPDSLF